MVNFLANYAKVQESKQIHFIFNKNWVFFTADIYRYFLKFILIVFFIPVYLGILVDDSVVIKELDLDFLLFLYILKVSLLQDDRGLQIVLLYQRNVVYIFCKKHHMVAGSCRLQLRAEILEEKVQQEKHDKNNSVTYKSSTIGIIHEANMKEVSFQFSKKRYVRIWVKGLYEETPFEVVSIYLPFNFMIKVTTNVVCKSIEFFIKPLYLSRANYEPLLIGVSQDSELKELLDTLCCIAKEIFDLVCLSYFS